MEVQSVSRRVGLTAITVLAVAAATFAAAPAYAHGPKQSQVTFEVEFLQETIDHHFAGVKMGELCLDKATSNKLRDVCSDIAVGQAAEIRVMQEYLENWYEIQKDPELMPEDEQMLQALAALSGKEFDIELSMAFIEHHRVQIGRSEACLEEAFHRQLIKLCKEQIRTQSREIRIFEKVIAAAQNNGNGSGGGHGHDRDHHNADKEGQHHGRHGHDRGEREHGDD
jgi:uncharacterized protein (DUF305 family)